MAWALKVPTDESDAVYRWYTDMKASLESYGYDFAVRYGPELERRGYDKVCVEQYTIPLSSGDEGHTDITKRALWSWVVYGQVPVKPA